jgi:hypothetical protein
MVLTVAPADCLVVAWFSSVPGGCVVGLGRHPARRSSSLRGHLDPAGPPLHPIDRWSAAGRAAVGQRPAARASGSCRAGVRGLAATHQDLPATRTSGLPSTRCRARCRARRHPPRSRSRADNQRPATPDLIAPRHEARRHPSRPRSTPTTGVQSPVASRQSPVTSHQSPVTSRACGAEARNSPPSTRDRPHGRRRASAGEILFRWGAEVTVAQDSGPAPLRPTMRRRWSMPTRRRFVRRPANRLRRTALQGVAGS